MEQGRPRVLLYECKKSFSQLTEKEKLYTYHLSNAQRAGIPCVLHQISVESPAVFVILTEFFCSLSPISQLKEKILAIETITNDDYEKFIIYCAKFFSANGNYQTFGSKKILPGLTKEKFQKILELSPNFKKIEPTWNKYKDIIFSEEKDCLSLNMNDQGGKSSYYLNGISTSEIEKINSILKEKNIINLNTRLLKLKEKIFIVLVASIDKKKEKIYEDADFGTIYMIHGEFDNYLKEVNKNLELAIPYASNELEQEMLKDYIRNYKTGNVEDHKESQRKWVKDKNPVIETNMGWVESYIDPLGERASYEGWVAVQDKEKSAQYKILVDNAEKFISTFPWDKDFEKPEFKKPDFISLDMVNFSGDGCPLGINIPNYQDVQEEVGFKNIDIGNGYIQYSRDGLDYILPSEYDLVLKYGNLSDILLTAGHELLGHGSGKLLRKDKDGKFNFNNTNLINPLTGKIVESYYKDNETQEMIFGSFGRSFEECRADCLGIYLIFNPEFCKIFGVKPEEHKDIVYIRLLLLFFSTLTRINLYNTELNKWGQAHRQAEFVILRFFLDKQEKGKEIVELKLTDDKKSFYIIVNKENAYKYGKDIIAEISKILHICRGTADAKRGQEFYEKYSKVDGIFLDIRNIIVNNLKPRRVELYYNMKVDNGKVELIDYEQSLEGVIQSNVDKYGTKMNEAIREMLSRYDDEKFLE